MDTVNSSLVTVAQITFFKTEIGWKESNVWQNSAQSLFVLFLSCCFCLQASLVLSWCRIEQTRTSLIQYNTLFLWFRKQKSTLSKHPNKSNIYIFGCLKYTRAILLIHLNSVCARRSPKAAASFPVQRASCHPRGDAS